VIRNPLSRYLKRAIANQGLDTLKDEVQRQMVAQTEEFGTMLGWSALYLAAFLGHDDQVAALMRHGEKPGSQMYVAVARLRYQFGVRFGTGLGSGW